MFDLEQVLSRIDPTKTNLYISGPMTGRPNWNFEAFNHAASTLRLGLGPDKVVVHNPAEWGEKSEHPSGSEQSHKAFVHRDLAFLAAMIDKVPEGKAQLVVLPEWDTSKGAVAEVLLGVTMGVGVFLFDRSRSQAYQIPTGEVTQKIINHYTNNGEANIAVQAVGAVLGPRRQAYGHPLDNCLRTAKMLNAAFNLPGQFQFTAINFAVIMMIMKIAREMNEHSDDNLVDIVGYALVQDIIRQEAIRRYSTQTEDQTCSAALSSSNPSPQAPSPDTGGAATSTVKATSMTPPDPLPPRKTTATSPPKAPPTSS